MRTTDLRGPWRAFAGVMVVAAVGGVPACQHSTAGESVRAGDFRVSAQTVPDPPITGDNRLLLKLEDSQGRAVEGASLDVLVAMPAMGAMAEMRSGGQVRERGGGTYEIDYTLQVRGDWTLTLRITAPGHAVAELRLRVSPPRKGVIVDTGGDAAGDQPSARTAPDGGVGQVMEISPSRQQLIGVTWGSAERRSMTLRLRAPGRVEVDDTRLADVTLRYPAFVEKLYVSRTGQSVREGEALLTLYSPDLLAAEQDYLVARRGGDASLVAAAEERLRLWGVTADQIHTLAETGTAQPRVTLRSPVSGVVLVKNVVEGTRAETGMALYRVGNLGRIWVLADLFQTDASVVATGQQATMTVPGLPGTSWTGRVSFIYPTVDERTRALRLRLEFGNAEATLRPGMYTDVVVEVPLGERLSVPDSALLRSGDHAYVFVRRGQGRLQPVEVEPGVTSGEFTEVRSGLEAGEEVATAATFLLSSEAQLRDALPRWRTP